MQQTSRQHPAKWGKTRIPAKSGKKEECPLAPTQYSVEVLARAIRQEKEVKGIHIKEVVNVSLFADKMILCIKDHIKKIS